MNARPATFAASVLAAALFAVAPGASAQQQNSGHSQQNVPHPAAHVVHFPMPAANYDANVNKLLKMLRSARPIGPVTQGDLNKAILMLKDCASRVEADGIVTEGEARYCRSQLTAFKRERLREIMATSSPEDWARWKAQLPTPPGGKDE